MIILLLETSTPVCSVALARDGQVLAERRSSEPNAHSSRMPLFVSQLFADTGLSASQLDAVCVSSGPGSYTGLRIGVSSAKGFCYALQRPLLSVPTLMSMANLYFRTHADYDGWVCPMLDARRMECYTALFDRSLQQLRPTGADVIEDNIYRQYLDRHVVTFIGDGAAKTQPVLAAHPNARFDSSFAVSAEGMADLAEAKLSRGETVDVAYFEPFYLKDFVAKKSVVRGLHA